MSTRKPHSSRLGRGLGSLIPTTPTTDSGPDDGTYFYCAIDRIEAMPGQPRRSFDDAKLEELAESIRESGLIQPLVVREADNGRYVLIAGERRLRASRKVGLTELPVIVREVTDAHAFALALIENIQREDLDPIEEALAYQRLLEEHGFTQAELSSRVGKSRSAVANAIRLLKLPEILREYISEGHLTAGHARAVLSVDENLQGPLAERIITESLSVRQAEDLARAFKEKGPGENAKLPPSTPQKQPLSPQMRSIETRLREHLGARVVLSQKSSGAGSIEVHYADREGLEAVLAQLLPDF